MMKPLYEQPDYHCPVDFFPYQDKCLHLSKRVETYDNAMVCIVCLRSDD